VTKSTHYAKPGEVERKWVLIDADGATLGRLRRSVADHETRRTTRETAIGEQRARLAQTLGLDVGGRVEHLLHAGATFGALVDHNNNITGDNLAAENFLDRFVLAEADARTAVELQDALVNAGGFDDGSAFGDIAVEDGEAGEDLREGPAGGAELARQRRMPAAKKRMRRPKLPWCGRESGLDGAREG
jgi:hypothetical protein